MSAHPVTTPAELFSVAGKVAIVTGASSGLGHRFAHVLAAAGARVVVAARRAERLEELAAEIAADHPEAPAVVTVAADVSEREDCRRVAREAVEAHGQIDVLVNNAGVGRAAPSSRETEEHFQQVLDVNVSGTFWMSQACQPHMPEGSVIINISSVLGHIAPPFPQAAYAASKAGVLGLTRNLAQEWSGRKGIRVNAICPGYFDSEITAAENDQLKDMVERNSILGRFGQPGELDGALLFLASDASAFITGTSIIVDGGMAAI
jgi:NAD(P)-dependent dehydrogenase (short-subunit alcohol dehydrogenase family)